MTNTKSVGSDYEVAKVTQTKTKIDRERNEDRKMIEEARNAKSPQREERSKHSESETRNGQFRGCG